MFYNNAIIEQLDLSMWDTEKLQNIQYIFYQMSNLQTLILSNWKFNDSMSTFFAYNSGLSNNSNFNSLILENVNTSNVTNMDNMFMMLPVTSLDLSSFDTSNVTSMQAMFLSTTNLQSITFGPKFVHKPEANIGGMFSGCPSLDRPNDESWQDVSFS